MQSQPRSCNYCETRHSYSWDNVARRVMSYYERLVYEHQELAEVAARRHTPAGAHEPAEPREPVNL